MLNFDRSVVKHGNQNIQIDCNQWLSDSFRVHLIRFRLGLFPDPTGGAYSAPPDPLAGLRGPMRRVSKGKGKGEGKGAEGNRETALLSQIPGSAPVDVAIYRALVLVTDRNTVYHYFRLVLIFLPNIQDGGQ